MAMARRKILPSAKGVAIFIRRASSESSPFLHNSAIPTLYFQRSLAKLPIPSLEKTLHKYLYFVKPLLSAEAAAAAERDVAAFAADVGPRVHAELLKWDAAHPETSYISDMWFDSYLRDRAALPLNYNPQITFRDDPVASKMDQATRAADLTHASVRFMLTLQAGKLEPDVYWPLAKPLARNRVAQRVLSSLVPSRWGSYPFYAMNAYPLDMSQYVRLFRSTRIPRPELDELVTPDAASGHIVVQRGPRFYKVAVLDRGTSAPLPAARIEASLRALLALSADVAGRADGAPNAAAFSREPPVGAMTGAPRGPWAAARAVMERNDTCRASLADIDSALFVLTLDDAAPETAEALSRAMLHGDARNRWFDKCLNLIVAANGKAGVNWEHAWGDGVAVLYYFNEVFDAALAMSQRGATAAPAVAGDVAPLRWDLSDSAVVSAIRAAEAGSDAVIGATELKVYRTDSLTKTDIKRSRLSPDGVMQMSLQLAHWRAHGYTPSTYESASTAGFKHGRTETIRSATPESAALCAVFSRGDTDQVTRYQALSAAATRHSKTARDASLGQGVDRHMFALQKWGARLGVSPPEQPLFANEAYRVFQDIRLSTSTLESPALEGGGFGPVSRSSYGVGYGIEERGAHFHVMNYSGGDVNNAEFLRCVETALADIQACIDGARAAGAIPHESPKAA